MMKFAYLLACAVLWYFLFRYWRRMFQQNSYRPERFLRWLRENPLPRFSRKSKLKFVLTARMKRLSVTSVVFALLLFAPAVFFPAFLWTPLAVLVFSPFLLLLADIVNSPVEKAITKGYIEDARRILSERKDLIIIGVTGSYGKTGTKTYLHRILSEKYNVLMTPGNFNTTLGVVRTVREMLEPYHQVFIVEMGAKQVGDIREICELVHPQIGIVTAAGQMHLETFGSEENIRKTKFELIRALPADGFGVVNMDSEGVAREMASGEDFTCPVTAYGVDAHRCDVRASGISYSPSGMEFDLIDTKGSSHFSTKLLGEANILNLSAAIIVARKLGVSEERIRIAVGKIQPVEHRLSISRRGSLTVMDDAYNSNPEGAAMALKVLSAFDVPEGGRRICVTPGFVELGPVQEEACRKLGERAARSSDFLVIVNRYNRAAIRDGALSAGMPEDRIVCADTLADAVASLSSLATPGSVILYENDLPDTFK